MTSAPMLRAALSYAANGRRVLPIERQGKRPLTEHGLTDATTDADTIRAWWARWPLANVAIACGAESGIVVLDVDVSDEKRGDETLVDLVAEHGPIGDTLHAITGSGGDHYYFAHPGGRVVSRNGKLGRGLDVKADGGYVVAPPSIHACGERYTWCAGGELQPLPSWLLALVRPPVVAPPPRKVESYQRQARESVIVRASRYVATMPPAVSGQGGHADTFAAALALTRGFALSEDDALDLMMHEYNPRCSPPWSERELRHKVESAARATHVGLGYLLEGRAA